MISIHINNIDNISQRTLDYFKKHEPIGCRDIATRDFLRQNGIDAYFSGCLTLTLGRTYRVAAENRRGGIYFVDYDMGLPENRDMDNCLTNILKKYSKLPTYHITHDCPMTMHPWEKLRSAEWLIRAYANASLVITSRIHCALPCLGLGVPVILVRKDFDKKRFLGLYDFFNYLGFTQEGQLINTILLDLDGKVINRNLHEPYSKKLQIIAEKFCNSQNINFKGISTEAVQFNDFLRIEQDIYRFCSANIINISNIQNDITNLVKKMENFNDILNQTKYHLNTNIIKNQESNDILYKKIELLYKQCRNRIYLKIKFYSFCKKISFGKAKKFFSYKKDKYLQIINKLEN